MLVASSSDTLLANGVQSRTKIRDVSKKCMDTTAAIENHSDDGQITLPPLTDDANQSFTRKVSDTLSNCNLQSESEGFHYMHDSQYSPMKYA